MDCWVQTIQHRFDNDEQRGQNLTGYALEELRTEFRDAYSVVNPPQSTPLQQRAQTRIRDNTLASPRQGGTGVTTPNDPLPAEWQALIQGRAGEAGPDGTLPAPKQVQTIPADVTTSRIIRTSPITNVYNMLF